MTEQRGGFVLGIVVGLLAGLAVALGVALYITKAPIPFINKVPQRTAEQDSAETERNRSWDPNAPLAGKSGTRQPGAAPVAAAPADLPPSAALPGAAVPNPPASNRPAPADPAAILSGAATPSGAPAAAAKPATSAQTTAAANAARPGADPFVYFVQAGAFARSEEAEQQRARLALAGYGAKITEREQSGRTVYRVRLGPYPGRDDAESAQLKLSEGAIESQIVRVEKP